LGWVFFWIGFANYLLRLALNSDILISASRLVRIIVYGRQPVFKVTFFFFSIYSLEIAFEDLSSNLILIVTKENWLIFIFHSVFNIQFEEIPNCYSIKSVSHMDSQTVCYQKWVLKTSLQDV
jgi:hypothetical protein